jgi:two-component system sensor histidine kinase KdpD
VSGGCVIAVLACTWVSFRLHQDLASVGFLYLVIVVLAAVYGELWQATAVSILSVACLDYFFDAPVFSFSVDRLSNWVELGAFEFTAVVISQLSNRARIRALDAVENRRETTQLYETARRLLLLDSYGDVAHHLVALVQNEFQLACVVLFDAHSATMFEAGSVPRETGDNAFPKRLRDAYFSDSDTFYSSEAMWFCSVRLGVRPVGALALKGTGMSELSARALASLCAIALERARSLDKACQAEAARQAEQLRTAVLDALAHKFKTPLTVIRTAVAGLPAAGPLSTVQTDLVTLIDQEASKLNDLSHRLVGAQDPGCREFEPQPEPLLLSRLIRTAIDEFDDAADRDRFRIWLLAAPEPPVLADRELILTALAQLLDNALKYSLSASRIDVNVIASDGKVVLTVRTKGLVVEASDRERIFERFYRAPGAHSCATGTGLGLSIVKTIAADHQGHVWAEGEPGYGTTFSLSLPIPQKVAP